MLGRCWSIDARQPDIDGDFEVLKYDCVLLSLQQVGCPHTDPTRVMRANSLLLSMLPPSLRSSVAAEEIPPAATANTARAEARAARTLRTGRAWNYDTVVL